MLAGIQWDDRAGAQLHVHILYKALNARLTAVNTLSPQCAVTLLLRISHRICVQRRIDSSLSLSKHDPCGEHSGDELVELLFERRQRLLVLGLVRLQLGLSSALSDVWLLVHL